MKKNPHPGKLIAFEGLDGSGQSTQANLLKDFLLKMGYQVVLTKEPTQGSEAGKKIKKCLAKKLETENSKLQELFAKDRGEHLEKVITPALKEGKIVISDRYFFSSLAYGTASGLDLNWLIKINNKYLMPDITFLLKVSPEVCFERIKKRNQERTLFEEKEKLDKTWQTYQILPKRFKNIHIINGERPIDNIAQDIKKIVENKLSKL